MVLAGHAAARMTQATFRTYHYLEPTDIRRLKQRRFLKNLCLPFVLLGLGIASMAMVISVIGILVSFFPPPPQPGQTNEPIKLWTVALAFLATALLVAAAIKAQRRLWKLGEPQDSDCFRDQRIQLREIKIV